MATNLQVPVQPDQPGKQEARRELIFAPKRVLEDPKLEKGQKDNTVNLTKDEVHGKAFEALGLLEEAARTKTTGKGRQAAKDLAASKVEDIDAYLAELDAQADLEGAELGDSYDHILEQEIQQLLAHPQVRKLLETEIQKELARYEKVEDKLKRLRTLRYAIKRATLDMHATYLRSKRDNQGQLVETAGKRIAALSGIIQKAEAERKEKTSNVSQIERGFITTQELIRYKRQIQEKGFALTPSREKLLQKIVEYAMAGRKVFLVGSTGTGKTELAFYAADEVSGDYEIIPWHEGTVMKDVFGQMQIARTEDGTVESQYKQGPLTRAMTKGRAAIHEEITVGSTRTMMGMKPFMNLRPGETFKIPEMNGTILRVDEKFLEIFTGNPKDERTKDREEMDPAILRMLKGIQVKYMPADELTKIAVATIMDESGLVKLTKSEVELIQHLAQAAELMQQCHDNALSPEASEELKKACGVDDLRINKNFLDPGTFFSLFSKWDYERRRGKTFRDYLAEQLEEFINDPKSMGVPEEKKILLAILKLKKIIDPKSTEENVRIPHKKKQEKPYILPSELGFLDGKGAARIDDNPFGEEEDKDDAEKDRRIDALQRGILDLLDQEPEGDADEDEDEEEDDETPPDGAIDPFTLKEAINTNLGLWVSEQYQKRIQTHEYFGMQNLRCIDNNRYPPPETRDIMAAMTREKIELINTFQKPLLLVTSIGVSMKDLATALGSQKGSLEQHNAPAFYFDSEADTKGDMVYGVKKFDQKKHEGKTKAELMKDRTLQKFKGWQVLVVEGSDETPQKGKKANDLLTEYQKANLSGLTPEDYLMLQAEGVRRGKPFEQGGDWTWLTGAYLKSIGYVPGSGWYSDGSRVYLGNGAPDSSYPDLGSRPAVRIL